MNSPQAIDMDFYHVAKRDENQMIRHVSQSEMKQFSPLNDEKELPDGQDQ